MENINFQSLPAPDCSSQIEELIGLDEEAKDSILHQPEINSPLPDVVKKIEQYKIALAKRDNVIKKLEDKLSECIQERDMLYKETKKSDMKLNQEFEFLHQQIKESSTLLAKQKKEEGKLAEIMDLKNKLEEQLNSKDKEHRDMEHRYQLLCQMHNESKEKHLVEMREREERILKEHEEEVNTFKKEYEHLLEAKECQLRSLEEERSNKASEVRRLKEELEEAISQNLNREKEMQDYVTMVKNLSSELEAKQDLVIKLDTNNQLISKEKEQTVEKLRESYENEIAEIKRKHQSEISLVAEQIDLLEKKQKGDEARITENLERMHGETTKYRSLLEEEKERNKSISRELEDTQALLLDLRSQYSLLNDELNTSREHEESSALTVNKVTEEKSDLECTISQLENEVKKLMEDEKIKRNACDELNMLLIGEKEAKNELNQLLLLESKAKDELNQLLIKEKETNNQLKELLIREKAELNLNLTKEKDHNAELNQLLIEEKKAKDRLIQQLNEEKESKQELNLLLIKEKETKDELNQLLIKEEKDKNELIHLVEKEKNAKNDLTLRLEEVININESLKSTLDEKLVELKNALDEKEIHVHQVKELEESLTEAKNKINELSGEVQNAEKELSIKKELENRVVTLNETVLSLQNSLMSLEQYKSECHNLHQRIRNLFNMLTKRDEVSNTPCELRDADVADSECDPVSLLETKVLTISSELEKTASLATEFQFLLQENSYYKSELDKLNTEILSNDISSLGSAHSENTTVCRETIVPEVAVEKVDSGCQAIVSTREQGFQTSNVNDASRFVASKTIEEDYILEEILVVPERALKGSVSLKDLKEIGISESAAIGAVHPSSQKDYEELKTKFYDAKFRLRSLENENSRLKHALRFKSSLAKDNDNVVANFGRSPETSLTDVIHERDMLQENVKGSDPEKETPCSSPIQPSKDIRKALVDSLTEKLVLLKKEKAYLAQINSLQQEVSDLRIKIDQIKDSQKESLKSSVNALPKTSPKKSKSKKNQNSSNDSKTKSPASSKSVKSVLGDFQDTSLHILHGQESQDQNLGNQEQNKDAICSSEGSIQLHQRDLRKSTQDASDDLDSLQGNISETKLKIQKLLNESLREDLKMRTVPNLTLPDEDDVQNWQHDLRNALRKYLETHHPCFSNGGEMITRVVEGWERSLGPQILKGENVEEQNEVKGENGSSELLQEMRKVVNKQEQFRVAVQELEESLIRHLENLIPERNDQEDKKSPWLGQSETRNWKAGDEEDGEVESDLLNEFEEITSSIVDRSQTEKIELLQNQRITMLKILEENKSRISEICRNHLAKLKETSVASSDLSGLEGALESVGESIETLLNEEVGWVEREYGDLLTQYSYEQSLHSHTHSLTLAEFRQRINALLHVHCKCKNSREDRGRMMNDGNFDSMIVSQNVYSLSSLSDTDSSRRLISLLSQVVLNLLHYYTVSQRFANRGQNSDSPPLEPLKGDLRNEESEEETSLKISEFGGQSVPDEGGVNPLDTTANSEGLLDDVDRNELVKEVLSASYPHLAKALKSNYDQVPLDALEREVQELVISLQAAAGMLRVFMLSKLHAGSPIHPSGFSTEESGVGTNSSYDKTLHKESLSPHSSSIEKVELDDAMKEFSSLSLQDYTTLKPPNLSPEERLDEMKEILWQEKIEREQLQKQLHQTQGLYSGLLDHKKDLQSQLAERGETIDHLLKEVEGLKRQLSETEGKLERLEMPAKRVSKAMEKDIKEKVKAMLAAKEKESMGQRDSSGRVRDLELFLEEIVRERDALNLKVSDLTQQLEVADRQLRSSRQFLEQQAAERDLEMDDLVKANQKLKDQLKERDSLATQCTGLQKEVRMVEKELREKYSQLEEEKSRNEEKQMQLAVAVEKVKDLRELVHSLESQLSSKCLEHETLQTQVKTLLQDFTEVKGRNMQLHSQLDALNQSNLTTKLSSKNLNQRNFDYNSICGEVSSHQTIERQVSLSEELKSSDEDCNQCQECSKCLDMKDRQFSPSPEFHQESVIDSLISRLERSTLGLEALQFTLVSSSPTSDEELSVREQLGMTGQSSFLEKSRSLSPGSLEAKLEEKFLAFERAAEVATKYTKDLEMQIRNLKMDYDEITNEREEMHQQLSALSSLKSELEAAAQESESLRQDFENSLLALKEELSLAKQKETDLLSQVEDLKAKLTSKEAEIEKATSLNDQRYYVERERLVTERKDAERVVQEVSEEKEMLRRQNSEHLIRISRLEARLEESKRADSPYELELRMRISSLQEELERNGSELTSKFREVEELRYTIKELRDKLVSREEELHRVNQSTEPVSLPQSAMDHRRLHVQALEEEIEALKTLNHNLNKKVEENKATRPDQTPVYLLEPLLDEKNAKIDEITNQIRSLVGVVQSALAMVENRQPIEDIANILRRGLSSDSKWEARIERVPCPEVQRRAPEHSLDTSSHLMSSNEPKTNLPDLSDVTVLTSSTNSLPHSFHSRGDHSNLEMEQNMTPNDLKDNAALRSSSALSMMVPPRNINFESFTLSTQTLSPVDMACDISKKEFDNLSAENVLLKDQILILEQEVKNLIDYQRKLEDDFSTAQELLESKEEELATLAEEVEDHLPSTIGVSESLLEKRVRELIKDTEALEKQCRELKDQLKSQEQAFEDSVRTSREEIEALRNNLRETVESNSKLIKEKDSLDNKMLSMERQLEEEYRRSENLKANLNGRNQEIEELSAQIDRILTQFKDANTRHEKRVKDLEREHFRELQEMKDKSTEREKQLCNEYEERMSAQVSDLALKLSREKDDCLKAFKQHYETLLSKALQEPRSPDREREKSTSHESRSSSPENLQKELRKELEVSESLDQSLLSYLGSETGVSRESSVLSEGGGADAAPEGKTDALRIQRLINKVHKEGIQVLTLSELVFLQNHQREGATPERGQDVLDEVKGVNIDGTLASKFKRKVEMLELSVLQEKNLNQELQEALRRERQEVDDLRKQLEMERSRYFDLNSKMFQVKGQNHLMEKELHMVHQDMRKLREQCDNSERQIMDLEEALSAERANFSHVSTTLNHQRKLAATSNDHHNHLIKELRNCLEKERTRVLTLLNELHDSRGSLNPPQSLDESQIKNSLNVHSSVLLEKDMRLAVTLDKERELQREANDLRLSLQALTEEKAYETGRLQKESQELRVQLDQLQNTLMQFESQNEALLRELETKNAMIKEMERMLKRIQSGKGAMAPSVDKVERSSSNDDDAVPKKNPNRRKKDQEIETQPPKGEHYLSVLNKLEEKEVEVSSLRRKLSQVEVELKHAKDKEKRVLMEVQKDADPLAASRIKNLSEFLEVQQKENLELCKSLARLTDDRRLLRQRVLMLEGVVDDLNVQLNNQEKYLVRENLNEKNVHCAERAAMAAETSALTLALSQAETKIKELEKNILEMQKSSDGMASKREDMSIKYLYWKYNRCESYRKALIWQKEYLMQLLKGYHCTEEKAIGRLTTLARNVANESIETPRDIVELGPKAKFKTFVLVVVAIQRMKILMRRWHLKRKLKNIGSQPPTVSAAESFRPSVSRASSPPKPSSDVQTASSHTPHSVTRSLTNQNALPSDRPITGLTPPTKEQPPESKKTHPLAHASQSRRLFGPSKDRNGDLNDYVQRLDYIHTHLGLPKTNS